MSTYLVKCSRCEGENPLFQSVCLNCGSILRDRIPNIDFWKTIGQLIENPKKALIEVVQSEQKNFATFVLIVSLFKIFLFTSLVLGVISGSNFSIPLFGFYFATCLFLIILTGYLIKFLAVGKSNKFRMKDFYASLAYSFVPQLMGLFILFTLEFIVFGEQMFTFNPSPFLIKKNFAYLFLSLELGLIAWNLILTKISFSIYVNKTLLAYILSTIIIGIIYFAAIIFL